MDVWEMATDALASQRHELIQASERNLLRPPEEEGPIIKKTHKGEEVVDRGGDVLPQLPVAAASSAPLSVRSPSPRSHTPAPGSADDASDTGEDVPLAQRVAMQRRSSAAGAFASPRVPLAAPAPPAPLHVTAPMTGSGLHGPPPALSPVLGAGIPGLGMRSFAPLVSSECRSTVDPKAPGLAAFGVVGRLVSGPPLQNLLPPAMDVAGRTGLEQLAKFVGQLRARGNTGSRSLSVLAVDAATAADAAALRQFCDTYVSAGRAATITAAAAAGVTLHLVPTAAPAARGLVSDLLGTSRAPLLGLIVFTPKTGS
jgi:hypothetical protein